VTVALTGGGELWATYVAASSSARSTSCSTWPVTSCP